MRFIRRMPRTPLYAELRGLYKVFAKYHRLPGYIAHRFGTNQRIRSLNRRLDRPVTQTNYSIHFISGHQQVDLLIWALASWHNVVSDSAQVYVHEDGTFSPSDRDLINRLFPESRIIENAFARQMADSAWLADFPLSRSQRQGSKPVHAIKLLDPYFVSECDSVRVLDTDILWFQVPGQLLDCISQASGPAFWASPRGAAPMRLKYGSWMGDDLRRLNSGVVSYQKSIFDLNLVEEFFSRLDPAFPYPVLLDQPAYAYTLGQHSQVTLLPQAEFPIRGPASDTTIAKHYTGPRREAFWFEGVARLSPNLLNPQEKNRG